MAYATLNAIRGKVRRLTGRDTSQLPNTALPYSVNPNSVGLDDYINSFYLYDFPAQFRSLKLKDRYTFNTVQGINVYPFDSEGYTTVQAPALCAKRPIALFYDSWQFYGVNYNWQELNYFSVGNGTIGPYSGYTVGSPITLSVNNDPANLNYPASRVQNILINANVAYGNTLNVTDNGAGGLIGDCTAGTIDYQTGQISGLVFTQAVPQGEQIQIQYNPVQPQIPLAILFAQNQFTLLPVPDRGYTIELVAYRQPTQALMNTPNGLGTPELSEWWETIAVGAAKKIFEDSMDMDGMNSMEILLQKKYQLNYTRTYAEMGKNRVATIFADQLNQGQGTTNGFGTGFGANGGM